MLQELSIFSTKNCKCRNKFLNLRAKTIEIVGRHYENLYAKKNPLNLKVFIICTDKSDNAKDASESRQAVNMRNKFCRNPHCSCYENVPFPESMQVCPVCHTPFDVPQQTERAGLSLNLGDANAISGGVNMTDQRIITNNITQIEREKSAEELKHEREVAFREACLKVYSDGLMTSAERLKLDDLRYRLGLDEAAALQIMADVAKRCERKSTALSPVHQVALGNVKAAIRANQVDVVERLMGQMKAMVQRYAVEDVQYTYYMLQAVLHPSECVEEYTQQREDKYWQSFWASVAFRRMGDIEKSELLVADIGDKWLDTIPQENVFVLATVNALIDGDKMMAKSLYENIFGEHSLLLSALVTALYAQLYGDILEPEELKRKESEGAFYMCNLFDDASSDSEEKTSPCDDYTQVEFPASPSLRSETPKDTSKVGRLIDGYGRAYELCMGPNTIGRKATTSQASVQIETTDKKMSRSHAIIVAKAQGDAVRHVLRNGANQNPTYVNGKLVEGAGEMVLADGDSVRMGLTDLIFKL